MLTPLLLLAVLFLLSWLYFYYQRPAGFPPGLPFVPVLGSLPFLGGTGSDILDIFNKLRDKYGDIVGFKFGSRWYVIVNGLENIKEVLVTRGVEYSGRPYRQFLFNKIQRGNSVGITDGHMDEQWKLQRHMTMMILRQLGYGKNSIQQQICTEAEALCDVLMQQQGRPLDIQPHIGRSVANVMMAMLFRKRYEYDDQEFNNIRNTIDELFSFFHQSYEINFIPVLGYIPKYKKILSDFKEVCDRLNGLLKKKIDEEREDADDNEEAPGFVKGYLIELEKHKGKMEDWCHTIVSDLLSAGLETTTTTLTWAVYYLAANPHVQAKVQSEVDSVVGSGRRANLIDRENMPYVEATLAELLRISVTGPFGLEHQTMQDTQVAGYCIPKDTAIVYSLWSVMMDPGLFPEPTCFRPERFINESGQFERPTNVIPFGMGKRACTGELLARQELFFFFTFLMQQFSVTPAEGVPWPEPVGTVTLTRKPPPYKINLTCRLTGL